MSTATGLENTLVRKSLIPSASELLSQRKGEPPQDRPFPKVNDSQHYSQAQGTLTSLSQIQMWPKSHSSGPAGKVSPWRQALLTVPSLEQCSQDRYRDNIKDVRFALATSASSVLRIPGPTPQGLGPIDHAHLLDFYTPFPILYHQCLSHQIISSSNRISTISGIRWETVHS